MDWLRREPLDEVYVSVPYQSGDSLRPLLSEMESMGLCVHLNVTVLEPYTAAAAGADGAWFPRLRSQVETAGGVPFVTIAAADHDFGAMLFKRLHGRPGGALVGLVHLGADHRGYGHPRSSSKARARCFSNRSASGATAARFISTSCAACTPTPSSANRS